MLTNLARVSIENIHHDLFSMFGLSDFFTGGEYLCFHTLVADLAKEEK